MSKVIKVENLSKAYRLGVIGTGTLSQDINRWWSKVQGKEDPFLKIGETNDRTVKGSSDIVWSLKDINFEINQGDAVAIIGRNGAGKSTLLKILSQITAPTTGTIKAHGRIASLLEVGTGFHPELTGRENVFLNGAILGMRKHEISRKFDEIVDFSGVERYIDTPVKRYSSGMYVRLAFAVAAYLESEILIIDEVLSVGDTEFQKKCLGKMGDISKGEGRTVLFVSHNITAVSSLCSSGIYLKNGALVEQSNIGNIVSSYLNDVQTIERQEWIGNEGDENLRIYSARVYTNDNIHGFHTNTDVFVEIEGTIMKPVKDLVIGFILWSQYEYELAYTLYDDAEKDSQLVQPQQFKKTFKIPANTLAEGSYKIEFDIAIHNVKRIIHAECNLTFSLVNIDGLGMKYLTGESRGKTSLVRANWFFKG